MKYILILLIGILLSCTNSDNIYYRTEDFSNPFERDTTFIKVLDRQEGYVQYCYYYRYAPSVFKLKFSFDEKSFNRVFKKLEK